MTSLRRHLRSLAQTRFVRWCLLTGFSFTLNLGLTTGLHEVLGVSEEVSFLVALMTVFVTSFVIMRYYVFSDAAGHGGRQLATYVASSVAFRGGEYAAFLAIHSWLGFHYLPTLLGVLFASFILKYFYYGLVVFGRRSTAPASDVAPASGA